MRSASPILLLLAVLLATPAAALPLATPDGPARITQAGNRTTLSGPFGRLALAAQATVFPHSLASAGLLAGVRGRWLALTVSYQSHPGWPMKQCGAGTETVLSVIALKPRPHETFHRLIESCWTNVDPDDFSFDAPAASLTLGKAGADATKLHIQPDGTVTR